MRKFLKWSAITVGVLLAVSLIVSSILIWTIGGRLEKRISALRAAGDPVTFADLIPEPVPPGQNAAVFLCRARDDVEAIDKELPNVTNGRLDEAAQNAVASALDAYPRAIRLLQQAADCPHYLPQADYTVGPPTFISDNLTRYQHLRSAQRLLNARAQLFLAQGKPDEALASCIRMFRLAEHIGQEPMLIGYHVAFACRMIAVNTANSALRSGLVAESTRDALEAELARHNSPQAFCRMLKTERVFAIESFRDYIERYGYWPVRVFWISDECAYLDLIARHFDLACLPYAQAITAEAESAGSPGRMQVMTRLAVPSLEASLVVLSRDLAWVRCLRVLNALQRQRGQAPQTEPALSQLGLPADVTTDPFNGAPLLLKKLPEGWLIYSVGRNLTDDGGKLSDQQDIGIGPIISRPGD